MKKITKKRTMSWLMAVAMVISLLPTVTLGAKAAEVSQANMQELTTTTSQTLKNGMTYYITGDVTVNSGRSAKNGLAVESNATVTLLIPKGMTLTVYGKHGSGTTGGGAAILLPSNATLIVVGGGTLEVYGGKAGNGNTGSNGEMSVFNDPNDDDDNYSYSPNGVSYSGGGGAGGAGGGGGGAGIGTDGGKGGSVGLNGASSTTWTTDSYKDDSFWGQSATTSGTAGKKPDPMGTLYVSEHISIISKDSAGNIRTDNYASNGGSSGGGGSSGLSHDYYNGGDKKGDSYRDIIGGAGGGGGGGGFPGALVGTGGGGGGQGGGGGRSAYIWAARYVGAGGGGGGAGYSGGAGGYPASDSEFWNGKDNGCYANEGATRGNTGSTNSGGAGGRGAHCWVAADSDGEKTQETGGSGSTGGSSGGKATTYTLNDGTGKYKLLVNWSGGNTGGDFGFSEDKQTLNFDLNTLYWNDAITGGNAEDSFYYVLCDENGNPIKDSEGNEIRGKVTFDPGLPDTSANLTLPDGLPAGKYTMKVGSTASAQGELPVGGFEIEAKQLDETDVAVNFDDTEIAVNPPVYNGSEIKPEINLSYDEKDLAEGIDYTVSYSDNTNAGTASVTVNFIGNYSGSITKTFNIAKCTPTVTIAENQTAVYDRAATTAGNGSGDVKYVYNGDGAITVKWYADDDGQQGSEISAPIDIGTYWVGVAAAASSNSNAAAEAVQKFTLLPYTLQESDIALTPIEFTYNVSEYAPAVSVTHDSTVLSEGTEYTVSQDTAGENAGSYTLTVTGKGNYAGTVSKNWNILKATPAVSVAPTAAAIAYGQPLSASALSGGTVVLGGTTVSGTFSWKEPATVPAPADGDTTPYTVVFTPDDTDNYNTIETAVTLTVHLTVNFNTNGGSAMAAITDATYNTALPTLSEPVRNNYHFAGWFKDAAFKQAWNFNLDTVTTNMTLYAKWSLTPVYSVGGNVAENGTTPVGGATVEIKRGNEVIAATTTDAGGNYSLDNIPDGEYNVVITDGDKVTTTVITITNGVVSNADVAMPAGAVSSGIEVVELPDNDHALTDTEGTLVGGLDKIAAAQTPAAGQHITIRLVVTPMKDVTEEDSHPHKDSQDAIKELAKGKRLEYFDLQLTKTVATSGSGETAEDIGSGNAEMLRIVIPFNTARTRSITVYRYHGGAAEAMKKNPASGEEGYEVGKNCVIIHAKRFSPYAIGFATVPTEPQHEVSVPKAENGTVAVNPQNAAKGSTVTVTAQGDEGFEVNGMTVTDENGNKIEVKRNSDGTYSFVMPDGKVTIDVHFGPAADLCPQNETCPLSAFADVNADVWYHNGVHYCLAHGLMRGISSSRFAPNGITTRAQLITILWRMEGEPMVEVAEGFNDVLDGDWCYNAVRWASANGIAEGYGDSIWAPNDAVTRQQMAAILWRYAKYKGYDVSVGEDTNILSYEDAFDVAEYAIPAMQWACGSGLIQGMEKNGTMYLDPYGYASRSQSAMMIYRFCTEINKQ